MKSHLKEDRKRAAPLMSIHPGINRPFLENFAIHVVSSRLLVSVTFIQIPSSQERETDWPIKVRAMPLLAPVSLEESSSCSINMAASSPFLWFP